jgi:hypothetical protein
MELPNLPGDQVITGDFNRRWLVHLFIGPRMMRATLVPYDGTNLLMKPEIKTINSDNTELLSFVSNKLNLPTVFNVEVSAPRVNEKIRCTMHYSGGRYLISDLNELANADPEIGNLLVTILTTIASA